MIPLLTSRNRCASIHLFGGLHMATMRKRSALLTVIIILCLVVGGYWISHYHPTRDDMLNLALALIVVAFGLFASLLDEVANFFQKKQKRK